MDGMPQFGASEAALQRSRRSILLSRHFEAALSHSSQTGQLIRRPGSRGSSQPGEMDDFGDNPRMDLIYHESQTAALCGVSPSSVQHVGKQGTPPVV